ncbi:MAG: DUF1318 domain-containing protein [Pseudomonadota bacterium]
MKNTKYTIFPLVLLLLASCVTINVYFPAAAAQQAAQEIVDEVLKQNNQPGVQQQQQQQQQEKSNPNTSMLPGLSHGSENSLLIYILDFVFPVAHAGANMSINTPKIRSLRNQLKQQHNRLVAFFNKGNIGYADNGLIKTRNTNGLNIKQKSTMKKLLNTANGILSNLYSEIAKANGHPEWKADIQNTFAKTWISQIQAGWMYFSGGQWKKK